MANLNAPPVVPPVRQFDRPMQDEWGIFDPQQAGIEALLRKLLSLPQDEDAAPLPPPATK